MPACTRCVSAGLVAAGPEPGVRDLHLGLDRDAEGRGEHAPRASSTGWPGCRTPYRLGADDAVLQKTPFSFDVSVWEFFWPLMAGARLVVATPGGHRDAGVPGRD